MIADREVMLRTLGKTGRWESDFEAEEAVDWAVGELARLRASLARADDVATDLWVAEQRVKDVEADRDQALAEVEEEESDALIESIVASMHPRNQVDRLIVRAAVVVAMDVCHETGDPATWRELIVETVLEAFGRSVSR